MKKRVFAILLTLAMCLALLPAAAFAAKAGDTTVADNEGGYKLSNPISKVDPVPADIEAFIRTNGSETGKINGVYVVPAGTTITSTSSEYGVSYLASDGIGDAGSVTVDAGMYMIVWGNEFHVFYGGEATSDQPVNPVTPPSSSDEFEIDDKGVLVKYNGKGGDVVIPNGVTGIGYYAFGESANLTSVTIPDSVTSIGKQAFAYCGGLTSVTIGSGVTNIEDAAFDFCTSLTSITIPDNVTSIGSRAFESCTAMTAISIGSGVTNIGERLLWGCKSLATIQVDSENKNYTAVDNVLFTKDMKTLVVSSPLKKGVYAIPGSVTSIGDWAFLECAGLTGVTIPNSVTSIGENAFMHCTGLTSVTIPDSVTGTGMHVFFGCTSLTNASVSSGMTKINDSMFDGCTALTNVYIPASITRIETRAFMDCNVLKDIYYGGSEAQWKAIYISVGGSNKSIESAAIHYNSAGPDQPAAPDTPAVQFSDVKAGDWYHDAVNWAVEKGITNGTSDTTFSPDADCTHDHILTFLWRAAGEPESSAALPFTPKNDWAAGALAWAYEKGMIGADLDEDAACASASAVVYIWQAKGEPAASYDGRFTDVSPDAHYAPAVAWAVDSGVTTGTSATTFDPAAVCSRARIVTFLQRAFQ